MMFAVKCFSQYKNRMLGLVGLLLLFFSGVSNSGDYTPPIGIPMPSFGIHETAPNLPSSWSSDVSGFYYVKTGGSNSGNGYPGNPRNAIPNSGIPAGAVVVIEGQYNTAHSSLTLNGTSDNPIYIISSETDQAIIKQKWVVTGSYFIIDGVNSEWDNSSGNGKLLISGSYGVVKNGSFRGDTNKGVGSVSISNGNNIVFYNNSVRIAGDWQAAEDQDTHAMGISTNISYLWVLDNSFSRSSGDGIQINAANTANQANTHHIYIGRNTAFENKQNGFWTKQATDVIFSENTAYNHIPSGSSPGVGLGQQYGPENVWYLFNKVHGNYGGITIASRSGGTGENLYIIGNQIYNNNLNPNFDPNNSWANAGITVTGGVNVAILNNVLANNSGGINTPIGSGEFLIYNNIIDVPTVTGANSIFFYEDGLASSSFVDNNIFNDTAVIRWGRSAQDNLSSFQSAFNQCVNCEEANPQYVDSLNGDFTLQASSSAIDAGRVSNAYQVFQNLYGIDIRQDVAGLTRPQGSGWDIGAFEYNVNLLAAPSNLAATVISSNQIDLSWTDNSNNEDGFTLQYSTDSSSYSEVVSLSSGTTSYSNVGLSENTTYYYRLFSYNGSGNSAYSNSVNATTLTAVDAVAPTLTLLGDNPQEINVGESYTELGASATDDVDGDISANITIDTSAVDTSSVGSYTVTYNVSDAANNTASPVTRVISVVAVLSSPVIVSAPSNLNITAISSNQIEMSWKDNSDNEDGFIIEYSTDAGVSFDELIRLSANATSYSHSGLSAMTAYHYRLSAYNGSGNSEYSNSTSAITQAEPVLDTTVPTLILLGDNPQSIVVDTRYIELGGSANDDVDGDISRNIVIDTSAVNIAVAGSYHVIYNVTDAAGNSAIEKSRVVNVIVSSSEEANDGESTSNTTFFGGALGGWGLFLMVGMFIMKMSRRFKSKCAIGKYRVKKFSFIG